MPKTTAICPICQRAEASFVSEHPDFTGKRIWFCHSCNHWFSYPEPTFSELDYHYENIYSHRRKSYFGKQYNLCMERRAASQFCFITKNVVELGGSNLQDRRIIDWGCGIGALVALANKEGADAIGFDSDPQVISTGKSLWECNIQIKKDLDFRVLEGKFDLLTMSHAIEHLSDIRQSLKVLLKVLRPGGHVFVEVPNCYPGMFTRKMDAESHLHFFSKHSLTLLIQSLGVQVLECVSCGPAVRGQSDQAQSIRTSRILQFVTPLVQIIRIPFRGIFTAVFGTTDQNVTTIYDGFYSRYYSDETGMWLRLIGRV